MTKEEALLNSSASSIYNDGLVYDGYTDSIYTAMDQFAKQTAIGFAEWIIKEHWEAYKLPNIWCNPADDTSVLTTIEIYDLFLTTLS